MYVYYVIKGIDKILFANDITLYDPSSIAFCQITFAFVVSCFAIILGILTHMNMYHSHSHYESCGYFYGISQNSN